MFPQNFRGNTRLAKKHEEKFLLKLRSIPPGGILLLTHEIGSCCKFFGLPKSNFLTGVLPTEPSCPAVVGVELPVLKEGFLEESNVALVVVEQLTMVDPADLDEVIQGSTMP